MVRLFLVHHLHFMTGGKKEGGALNAGVCQTPRDVGTHSGGGGSMCEGAGSLTGNPHTKHSLPSRLRQTRTAAGHQTDYEGAWRRLPSLSIPLGPATLHPSLPLVWHTLSFPMLPPTLSVPFHLHSIQSHPWPRSPL